MDLRPAAVLETDAARIDELRRRRDSMAVTTRIRMVDQPPEGLLPLSLFGRTPLPDRTALHSVHPEYQSIRRLGFFNPRRNEVWLLDVDRITPELIDWTDRELIGYPA